MGIVEIISVAIPLILKYGPDFADGIRKMWNAARNAPETTEAEKAELDRLMIEMDAADKRVRETPLPGQRT
jgi:hypothetical protein